MSEFTIVASGVVLWDRRNLSPDPAAAVRGDVCYCPSLGANVARWAHDDFGAPSYGYAWPWRTPDELKPPPVELPSDWPPELAPEPTPPPKPADPPTTAQGRAPSPAPITWGAHAPRGEYRDPPRPVTRFAQLLTMMDRAGLMPLPPISDPVDAALAKLQREYPILAAKIVRAIDMDDAPRWRPPFPLGTIFFPQKFHSRLPLVDHGYLRALIVRHTEDPDLAVEDQHGPESAFLIDLLDQAARNREAIRRGRGVIEHRFPLPDELDNEIRRGQPWLPHFDFVQRTSLQHACTLIRLEIRP